MGDAIPEAGSGSNTLPEAGSGLYTGSSEGSFKPITPEIQSTTPTTPSKDSIDQYGQIHRADPIEPVVSSQNEIDLSQYREKLVPPKSTVERNWENGFNDSPSLVMAKEIKHKTPTEPKVAETTTPDVIKEASRETPTKPDTSPYDIVTGSGYDDPKKPDANKKPAFDLEYGSDEDVKKRDLHQEALDSNKKANEGFDPKSKFSKEGQRFIEYEMLVSENTKLEEQNRDLIEQNRLMIERMNKMDEKFNMLVVILTQNNQLPPVITGPNKTTPYEQDPALAAALDPNKEKPLNPLEDLQEKLRKEQEQKQIDFAKQVAEEDRLHNPLNPLYVPPVAPTVTTPEITPVTPEVDRTDPKRERNLKRAAFIAGAVVGGTTGILGGAHVAGIGVLACLGAGFLNKGLDYLGSRRINSLQSQLNSTTDPEARAKLEKRKTNWEKIRKGSIYAASFIAGAGIGFAATGLFSKVFMGGHGLVWNTPEPTGIPVGGDASGSIGGGRPEVEQPTGSEIPQTSPETYQGNDFIDKNGQIHTGGDSPWDNKYVAEPAGNLPGGAENASNYTQGKWGRTPSVVDNFLKQNNITDTSMLDPHTRDRILKETWLALQRGDTNPDMTQILKHVGTDGANKLLAFLGK